MGQTGAFLCCRSFVIWNVCSTSLPRKLAKNFTEASWNKEWLGLCRVWLYLSPRDRTKAALNGLGIAESLYNWIIIAVCVRTCACVRTCVLLEKQHHTNATGFRVPCRALPQPPKAAACMWRELSLSGASVPQEPLKSSPFVESEHCNDLPCLTGVLGSAGGGGTSTGEDGNRTGHKSPPWEAWTRPASLSWVRVIHSEKEGRHTGPRSRRYRKAIGSQSTCKGSKTQRLTQPQGTRFYSDFSQALPGEPEHFSHSMLMTEDLRHTSVSRDQQGDLSSPNSGPKDDVQQLPPSWCFWFFQTKASQYLGSPLLGELSWPEHLTSCDPARYPWGQTFPQLRPTEGNWGQISSMHMRNIQLGFSALFLTSPNILRKPSNMKERIQTKWVTKNRNNDQKWT